MVWQSNSSTLWPLPTITQRPDDGVVPRLCVLPNNSMMIAWAGKNTVALIQLGSGYLFSVTGLDENDGYDFIDFAERSSTSTVLCLSTSGVVYELDLNLQQFTRYAPFESLYGTAPITAIEIGNDVSYDEIWFGWDSNLVSMDQFGNVTSQTSLGSSNPLFRIRQCPTNGWLVGCTADTYFYAQPDGSQPNLSSYNMSSVLDIVTDVCLQVSVQFGFSVEGIVVSGVRGGNGRAFLAQYNNPTSLQDFSTGFYPNLPMTSVGNLSQSGEPADFVLYQNDFAIYVASINTPGTIDSAAAFDSPPSQYGANFVAYSNDGFNQYATYGQTFAFGIGYIWVANSTNTTPSYPPMDPPGLAENDLDIIVTWPAYDSFAPDGYLISRTDETAGLFSTISTDSNTFEYADDQCVDGHTYSYTIHAFQNGGTTSPESNSNSLLFFLTPELRIDVFFPPSDPIISLLLPPTPIDSYLPDNGWQIAVAPPGSETRIDFNSGIYSVRNLAYGYTTVRAVTDSSPFKVQDIHYHVQESPVG